MDSVILNPLLRLLEGLATTEAVRITEKDGSASRLWAAIVESGYLNIVLPEESGGAGLSLADIVPMAIASGECLVPEPLVETVVARALIAEAGIDIPDSRPIHLWPTTANGSLRSQVAPPYCAGGIAMTQCGQALSLRELRAGDVDGFGIIPATLTPEAAPIFALEADIDLLAHAASITAALMSGAMNRLLELCVNYANEREQFARPLAKFQVIQHMLATMAGQAAAASLAVSLPFDSESLRIRRINAGAAKCVAGEAANVVCKSAHAVFGALGISEEFDLQLYTRRIKRWQLSFGTDSFWATELGRSRLAAQGTSADFVRNGIGSAQ